MRGEGFVAASYRHRMSRAGDPRLHTYVIVANLTCAERGYTALDARSIYEHQFAADAVYRAVLRAEARAQGRTLILAIVGASLLRICGRRWGDLRFRRR